MAPKWLHLHDEAGKRTSVFASLTTPRNNLETASPRPLLAFLEHDPVPTEHHDMRPRPPTGRRSSSRKRMSFFGRGATTDYTEDTTSSLLPPQPTQPEISQPSPNDPPLTSAFDNDDDDDDVEAQIERSRTSTLDRKRASQYFRQRSRSVTRWARREDREGRPAISLSDRDRDGMTRPSISSPFNFQHVTHTQHQELPSLNSVGDHDLVLSFWAASAQQLPQNDLRGIKAEKIEDTQRVSRPATSLPVSRVNSRPVSPSRLQSPHSPFTSHGRPVTPTRPGPLHSSFSSSDLPQERHRPRVISRSTSLASLVAEQRTPPKMVHPAFRSVPEPSPSPSEASTVQPTPILESARYLDAVPEELETASAPVSPVKQQDRRVSTHAQVLEELLTQQPQREMSVESMTTSTAQETDGSLQWQNSIPSLCSGDSWEEEVDYCYNMGMEAETSIDIDWDRSSHRHSSPAPHDSVLAPPRKTFADHDRADVSPRTSMANHQRNKSSMTLAGFFPFVKPSSTEWNPAEAFENPRIAPETPPVASYKFPRMLELPFDFGSGTFTQTGNGDGADEILHGIFTKEETVTRPQSDARPVQSPLQLPSGVKGHLRAKSLGSDEPEWSRSGIMGQRWSFIPPPQLSASVLDPDLQALLPAPKPRPISYGASIHPPPSVPLPPLPSSATPSAKPSTRRATISAVVSKGDEALRRPQTWEERPAVGLGLLHFHTPSRTSLRESAAVIASRTSPRVSVVTPRASRHAVLPDDVFAASEGSPDWI